jgi:fused signal recognition particle receptor
MQTDGVILTKLDSTAKGGIVLAVAETLKLPVVYIGVGEAIDDFEPFDAERFVDALLG